MPYPSTVPITLFSTLYPEKNEKRACEYEICLKANIENNCIQRICILNEGTRNPINSNKVELRPIASRPTYNDFFRWINESTSPNQFSIIANTDISVPSSINIIRHFDWTSNTCLALSRWDVDEKGGNSLFERGDSQDVWIFKGKVENVNGNFPLGVYDCDNKIAWELEQAGYRVINPCYAVRTYHHHQCGYRSYEAGVAPDYGIRPPFLYVEPDNFWGPIRAWQIKRELNLDYLPWMMTRQRFWRYPIPRLWLRVFNRLQRAVTPPKLQSNS